MARPVPSENRRLNPCANSKRGGQTRKPVGRRERCDAGRAFQKLGEQPDSRHVERRDERGLLLARGLGELGRGAGRADHDLDGVRPARPAGLDGGAGRHRKLGQLFKFVINYQQKGQGD
jgi:hypothetical protein